MARDFGKALAATADRCRADGPHARAGHRSAARSRIARVTEALSLTGRVLGMGQTAVKPPRAAARVPVSMVSELSPPGSRRWQCRSMKPGATIRPAASSVFAIRRGAACRPNFPEARRARCGRRRSKYPSGVGAAGRIDHAAILNPQHERIPLGSSASGLGGRAVTKSTPCEQPGRW